MAGKKLSPESQMIPHQVNPEWYLKSIKEPIFQTSTYKFDTAEEGEKFFQRVYGGKEHATGDRTKLIYSRFTYPNLISLESKFKHWDHGEDCAFFNTGMAAISTVFFSILKPGDLILKSEPIYGGSDSFIKGFLKSYGIEHVPFSPKDSMPRILKRIAGAKKKIKMAFIETPCNPTNDLIDIQMISEICDGFSRGKDTVPLVVDNTFLGPVGQRPADHGADLTVYSASKYIGGHGDLVAGVVSGKMNLIQDIKALRYSLGNMVEPNTAWLLNRSLETLKLRMDRQCESAELIADYLDSHSGIEKVKYLGLKKNLSKKELQIANNQCLTNGAMISFELKGGKPKAFKFLNSLSVIRLAVSLGGTESNASHPWTMSHSNVKEKDRKKWGITPGLVRLSVGVEDPTDLIRDIKKSLAKAGID